MNPRHLAAVKPAPPRVRTSDQFYDRAGNPISLSNWATRRRDPDYCCVGYWEGEGSAWIYTFWLGIDMSFGVGALPAIFDTHVAAFGNQPHVEWTCPTDSLTRALTLHKTVVSYVERGITPPHWDLDNV
jgi:hypothetical protein